MIHFNRLFFFRYLWLAGLLAGFCGVSGLAQAASGTACTGVVVSEAVGVGQSSPVDSSEGVEGVADPDEAFEPDEADVPRAADEPALPELWFPVGEELVYRIHWGVIPAGETRVTTEWVEEDGRTLLAIRIRTRTNRVLEKIYAVDDVIESIIDPHTFLPVRFTKNLSEGRYRAHEITEFDYATLTAHWRSETRDKEETFALQPDTRDLITFAYYMRRQAFEPGTTQEYRVMADDKIYDLWLQVKDRERVRLVNYGRVASVEVEPEAAFEGLFVRRGRLHLWVSDDDRRIVTQLVGRVPVANVRLLLHEVLGPGDDDWVSGEGD
jgi:hypothetical protein